MIFRFLLRVRQHQPTYQGSFAALLDDIQTKLKPPSISITWLASLYGEDRSTKIQINEHRWLFEEEPQQRKSQHHQKDQEGQCLSPTVSLTFLICMSEVVHCPVTFSLTDVKSGKVTQDVISVNRVIELQGGNWISKFSCPGFLQ